MHRLFFKFRHLYHDHPVPSTTYIIITKVTIITSRTLFQLLPIPEIKL